MLDDKRVDALVAHCREMIRIYSVTGSEKDIAEYLRDYMLCNGFDEAWINSYGSVIGKIKGTGGGRSVLLDGHIDTVTVADLSRWTHDPFAAEIDDTRIYGRGAADMKGALSAMVAAAGWLSQDKRPAGDVYVTGTNVEETAEGCTLLHILKELRPDLVIIGEATQLNLNIGQRGRGEIVVRTIGKPAHSSNPEVGINAVYKMMHLLSAIRALPVQQHELLGKGIIELTDIVSTPYPGASVVPESCTATFDRRLLTGETEKSVLNQIQTLINELQADDRQFKAEAWISGEEIEFYTGAGVHHTRFAPAWCLDREKNAGLIDAALEALQGAGLSPKVSSYQFCTNGSASAGILGIPTIGFGPCAESQAHVVDEYIEIEQLKKAAEGYYALIGKLCGCE